MLMPQTIQHALLLEWAETAHISKRCCFTEGTVESRSEGSGLVQQVQQLCVVDQALVRTVRSTALSIGLGG